jgi:hypothetical protein
MEDNIHIEQLLPTYNLAHIATIIKRNWKKPYFAALPYLNAMSQLDTINDRYYAEDAHSIILYFISNAGTWRGPIAKAVKAELKKRAGIK